MLLNCLPKNIAFSFNFPIITNKVSSQKVRVKIKKMSPLVIKCKRADCLSILVSFEKKQRTRKFIFKTYDLSLNQYVLKGLATVFSLGSLRCEFQIFLHFVISGRVLYHVICPDLLRSCRKYC